MVEIIIPTLKKRYELKKQIEAIESTGDNCEILVTGLPASAAVNRNCGLRKTRGEIVIMLDDDIGGFYPGWTKDMIKPLEDDSCVFISSSRLRTSDGFYAHCMGMPDGFPLYPLVRDAADGLVPTAAIAMRRTIMIFDMNFIGSGFEDTAYCLDLRDMFPYAKIVVNNGCALIHHNEMKNQGGEIWEYNRNYFLTRFPHFRNHV